MRRVAITGRGIVSVLGNNTQEVLASLQHGQSGIEFIPERKAMGFRSALGGRIKSLPPLNIPKRNLRQMGPGSMFAVHAAQQALENAGGVSADRLYGFGHIIPQNSGIRGLSLISS